MNAHLRVSRLAILFGILLLCNLPAQAVQERDFVNNPEVIAQWSLNIGSLALDESEYLDALAYFEDAYNSSQNEKTKVRALLLKATTFATFLHSPDSALKIYQTIRKQYPDFAETAFYQEALLLFENGNYPQVTKVEEAYLKAYPNGRFRFQTDFLRQQSEQIIKTKSYQQKVAQLRKAELEEQAWRERDSRRRAEIKAAQQESQQMLAEALAKANEISRLRSANRAKEAASLKLAADAEAIKAARLQQEAADKELARKRAADESRQKIIARVAPDFAKIVEPTVRVLLHKSATSLAIGGKGLLLKGSGKEIKIKGPVTVNAANGQLVTDKGETVWG